MLNIFFQILQSIRSFTQVIINISSCCTIMILLNAILIITYIMNHVCVKLKILCSTWTKWNMVILHYITFLGKIKKILELPTYLQSTIPSILKYQHSESEISERFRKLLSISNKKIFNLKFFDIRKKLGKKILFENDFMA